jgi:deoxyribodipyrimidine photolyase
MPSTAKAWFYRDLRLIGRDYPAPIVDHGEERRRAIERYRAVA